MIERAANVELPICSSHQSPYIYKSLLSFKSVSLGERSMRLARCMKQEQLEVDRKHLIPTFDCISAKVRSSVHGDAAKEEGGKFITTACPVRYRASETIHGGTSRIHTLRKKANALRRDLDAREGRRGELTDRIERTRATSQELRSSRTATIAALRERIIEADSDLQQKRARRNIVRRGTTEIVGNLKQAWADPPDDRDELESESVWEINTQLEAMRKLRRQLVEKRSVVRTARGNMLERFGESFLRCADTNKAAVGTVTRLERVVGAVLSVSPGGERSIVQRVVQREAKVQFLQQFLRRAAEFERREEKKLSKLMHQLDQMHASAIRSGHLTPLTLERLQDTVHCMAALNHGKEQAIEKITRATTNCHKSEAALTGVLHRTRTKVILFGDKSFMNSQSYARLQIQHPEDRCLVTAVLSLYRCAPYEAAVP